ncbi:DUF1566 domain-containing protein [Polaromonas jejuensis]|uniref:DUF1566 domain-containing protein n=1 Tax=Polaromonas jejuensis TaxID=457502 RepID=A0ABW0QGI4_9BURK|nr:DUF1566 domain-containing protein [Polaromonas jejuensis]
MQLHITNATIHLSLPSDAAPQGLDFPAVFRQAAEPAAPSSTLPPPAHGDYWPGQGGRYICTLPELLGVPARHLIASEHEVESLEFGPSLDVPGARSQLDGPANTAALLATGQDHPAAKWADAYTADGHTDFYLPSRLDLVMAHICAPQLFQKSGWYWSSTQTSRDGAFVQDFEGGYSYWDLKDNEHRVRAFRWVHLSA